MGVTTTTTGDELLIPDILDGEIISIQVMFTTTNMAEERT
jgi:hypothetical protein